jgi:DNA (cytosine-5)-methyltransferase 1
MSDGSRNEGSLRVSSFFSGCGGMDLGVIGGFTFNSQKYESLPFKIVHASDFDPRAVEVYNKNFEHKALVSDITSLSPEDVPDSDLILGGFPCQSFSIVAQNPKRLGIKDSRGQLFFEMKRLIESKRPAAFVAENVKGLISANKGEALPLILEEFRLAGYHVQYRLLNAADFGVPQRRQRVFIVGFLSPLAASRFEFPNPTHENSHVKIRGFLETDQNHIEHYFFSEKAVSGLKKTKHFETMNKGRAQDIDGPSNTLGAHLAKVSLNSTDPVLLENGRYRMFTPREVARLQSFPDDFVLAESRATSYRVLGNAVAPVMMWHVAKAVHLALRGGSASQG